MDVFAYLIIPHFLMISFNTFNVFLTLLFCRRQSTFKCVHVFRTWVYCVCGCVAGWGFCYLQHAILAGRWAVAFPRADRLIKFCSAPRYSGHD